MPHRYDNASSGASTERKLRVTMLNRENITMDKNKINTLLLTTMPCCLDPRRLGYSFTCLREVK